MKHFYQFGVYFLYRITNIPADFYAGVLNKSLQMVALGDSISRERQTANKVVLVEFQVVQFQDLPSACFPLQQVRRCLAKNPNTNLLILPSQPWMTVGLDASKLMLWQKFLMAVSLQVAHKVNRQLIQKSIFCVMDSIKKPIEVIWQSGGIRVWGFLKSSLQRYRPWHIDSNRRTKNCSLI